MKNKQKRVFHEGKGDVAEGRHETTECDYRRETIHGLVTRCLQITCQGSCRKLYRLIARGWTSSYVLEPRADFTQKERKKERKLIKLIFIFFVAVIQLGTILLQQ